MNTEQNGRAEKPKLMSTKVSFLACLSDLSLHKQGPELISCHIYNFARTDLLITGSLELV